MTQYLNPADSFATGSTAPPTSPTSLEHYIRLAPWSTDPAHGSGGTGFSYGAATFAGTGMFYSGWTNGARAPVAALSTAAIAQSAPLRLAMMPRAIELADADVSCLFLLQSTDPTYIAANGATFAGGVGARLSGGTPSGSNVDSARLVGGDGYWFVLMYDHSGGLGGKLQLLRVNAGTVTRLSENPSGAATFAAFALLAPTSARTMRMTVAAESGNVRINCYTATGSGAETLVFSVLDSSGSKITAAGRCGLFLSSEFQRTTFPARKVAALCSWFQIKDGATVVHRDEWARTYLPYGNQRFPGFSGHEAEYLGYSLMSGWSGDYQYSNTPTMVHDQAGGRVSLVSGGFLQDHWWFSSRPADDPRRQDRTIVIRFDTGGGSANAAVRAGGIFLRATPKNPSASAVPIACYYATISISDTTGVVTVELRRKTQALGDQLLAQNTALVVTVDANITFGFSAQTLAPDTLGGYAQLDVTVNGTQVVLVAPPSPLAGVVITSAGSVVDATAQRVLMGTGEGIRALIQNANPRIMYFDTWALGAGSGSVDLPENDQASIPVAPEYTTTVGTLSLPTETSVVLDSENTNIRHELDSDHVYTSTAVEFERRRWTVTVLGWTADERDEFLALLELTDGVVGAFNWTPPGYLQPATVVHFMEPVTPLDTVVPGQAYAVRFKLEELHAY